MLGACVPLCFVLSLKARRGKSVKVLRKPAVLLAGKGKVCAMNQPESVAEAMMRLSLEIEEALIARDTAGAARARRAMEAMQLEKPAAACRHLILEDCLQANVLIHSGEYAELGARTRAVRKLGRWLRWRRTAAKDLVPVPTALEGLLAALRAEPEVAWAAQCSLLHAARCSDGAGQSVRDGNRGALSRLLLNSPQPFPLVLPRPTLRDAGSWIRVFDKSTVVHDFFSQLESIALMDPGYGVDPYAPEVRLFDTLARLLGNNLQGIKKLNLMGFEDCAIVTFLPQLALPKLKSLRITGSCHGGEAERALVTFLHQHGAQLTELELTVWTETFCEADDPLVHLTPMPHVRRVRVRAPVTVSWTHLARTFPNVEEVVFLYDQDFALNALAIMEDYQDIPEDEGWNMEDMLHDQVMQTCRDAVLWADDLHKFGFSRLAQCCCRLRSVYLQIVDTSYTYEVPEVEDSITLCWRRAPRGHPSFRRDPETNNAARTRLADSEELHEEAMSVVVRSFDDPSLEAQFGIPPIRRVPKP